MHDDEKVPIVLVAAKAEVLNNIRDALTDTNIALLYAETQHEAIAMVECLKSEIDLAIIELELPDYGAWELIRQFRWRRLQKPVKILATSLYHSPELENVGGLNFDAVVERGSPGRLAANGRDGVADQRKQFLLLNGHRQASAHPEMLYGWRRHIDP
jgi:CheY-like chemotaxis protein